MNVPAAVSFVSFDDAGGPPVRLRLLVHGLVQGVGFRPFVHRLAVELRLTGFVRNSAAGAWLEVEGPASRVRAFRERLGAECPTHAEIHHREEAWLEPAGTRAFEIETTTVTGPRTALVLPDLATCPDCLAEIRNPAERRHRYPFTNCTRCGPRFSILESPPWDRERTTMRGFTMCPECRSEFDDPADRRFHAQPIACPNCGPRLRFRGAAGADEAAADVALAAAVAVVRRGEILALKGVGGFQLIVRADDEAVVARLRARKRREARPLALMSPSLEHVRRFCTVSDAERRLLESAAAPIVLLARCGNIEASGIADAVAPGCPWLGVMLPASPLHHLLLGDLGITVVATSGNLSDEPLCLDDDEAYVRLGGVADAFLGHDRRIIRQVDDSVARVVRNREQILRRARGYAPLPLRLPESPADAPALLAVGAHLKNALAVVRGAEVFPGPHVGDLETAAAAAAFDRAVADLPVLLDAPPAGVVADLHPDYLSTQRAIACGLPRFRVAHHEAHAWACLADNDLAPPALALSWDGTGLGPDGTIWGGEFLELPADGADVRRRGWLRPFALPGGDGAAREPGRSLLGLLVETGLEENSVALRALGERYSADDRHLLATATRRGVNAPRTSSMGRLFDAVAALAGLAERNRFEGEAAMRLEWAAWRARSDPTALTPSDLPRFEVTERDGGWVLDWEPWLRGWLEQMPDSGGAGAATDRLALALHHALVEAAVVVVERVGIARVLLTGGCFQNRLLTELLIDALHARGFSVYWHQRIPPNDGGIATGQIVAARRRWRSPHSPLPTLHSPDVPRRPGQAP